ncbi:piggyBac transposable element-derived protein 4-like [Ischnura elegans]|uniref:piggyBac transposable element-derived protein 4-like n=1 Tax=Ischnura elegans TaxID=197161 RepID=UPI001ED86C8A|nr:piggyBac transposable element-derived protein 4-like [Ischnura elegans]
MKRRVSQGTSRRENNPTMNPVDNETPGPSGLSASKKKQPRKTLREDEIRALAMDSSDDNFSSGSSFVIDSDGSDSGESDSESGGESCTTEAARGTETARGTVTSEAVWAANPPVNRNTLSFVGSPGLKKLPSGSTAKDYFSLVFTDEFFDLVIRETERNAECIFLGNPSPRARITDWRPLTREEFEVWLGLLFHMGTVRTNRISDYWKKSIFFSFRLFRQSMARDRFLGILQALHFAKNADENEPVPSDRLYKVRPLMNCFHRTMASCVSPGRELCIDESMLLWRGRLNFRQYMQGKRHKHGIKMYMLCEPAGLVHRMIVYAGSGDSDVGGRGHGDKVVHKLLEDFKNKGHSVFLNNYYNNVPLARDLIKCKTYCTGTLRAARKENPREVFGHKLAKNQIVARWSEEGICVFRWRDKRDVSLISSEFGCNLVPTERSGRGKPEAVVEYNKFMGGVDHCDQLLSYYTCQHKSLKWYKKLAIHLFQIMLINSYILYNKFSGNKKSLYEYRMEVIESLLSSKISALPPSPQPKKGLSHFPAIAGDGTKGKKPQKRCRVCYAKGVRKAIIYICPDYEGEGSCLMGGPWPGPPLIQPCRSLVAQMTLATGRLLQIPYQCVGDSVQFKVDVEADEPPFQTYSPSTTPLKKFSGHGGPDLATDMMKAY